MYDVERITAQNFEARRAAERYTAVTRRVLRDNRRAERWRSISSFAYMAVGALLVIAGIAVMAEDTRALCVYGTAAFAALCAGEWFSRKATGKEYER